KPTFPNFWMENLLQLFPGVEIAEDNIGEFITAELSVWRDNIVAKGCPNFAIGGLARCDKFAGKLVGIHNLDTPRPEKPGGGGFAHANATGQSE
ncbi:MAG TPA: hypothetical protein VGJ73_22350, partial [Verrucomicrobiae bacterium]